MIMKNLNVLPPKVERVAYAWVTCGKKKSHECFVITKDIRDPSRNEPVKCEKFLVKANGIMTFDVTGIAECQQHEDRIDVHLTNDQSGLFVADDDSSISVFVESDLIASTLLLPVDGPADVTLVLARPLNSTSYKSNSGRRRKLEKWKLNQEKWIMASGILGVILVVCGISFAALMTVEAVRNRSFPIPLAESCLGSGCILLLMAISYKQVQANLSLRRPRTARAMFLALYISGFLSILLTLTKVTAHLQLSTVRNKQHEPLSPCRM